MKIQSSSVGMTSSRNYIAIHEKQSAELITRDDEAATLELSDASKGIIVQLEENKQRLQEEREAKAQENLKRLGEEIAKGVSKDKDMPQAKSKEQVQLEILKRMMEILKRLRNGNAASIGSELKQLESQLRNAGKMGPGDPGRQEGPSFGGSSGGAVTGWTRTTVKSEFFAEVENTCFQAQGIARTADGREIRFGVSVEMSRSFCARYESFTQEEYICTDPLVINLDANVGSVSDQKFLFDLDADGVEEEISFVGQGSGFLALDKNGDGVINDGSELFGTRSGNGFADLAAYDKDGNGWIDENDEIFKDLKIWMKDEQGNNKLISLKEAGVGAIYLGYADTEFSLNNQATNRTNGVIRSTGVYLKENGGAGTVQHIDLTL